MFSSHLNSSQNGQESGLDGSDLEMEFFSSQMSGLGIATPFEPKRSSTPLNTSGSASWNDCYSRENNMAAARDRQCVPTSGCDDHVYDRQVAMERNAARIAHGMECSNNRPNYRRLPVSNPPIMVSNTLRLKSMHNAHAMDVPDYNLSTGSSPTSFSTGSSSARCLPGVQMGMGSNFSPRGGNSPLSLDQHFCAGRGNGCCNGNPGSGSPLVMDHYNTNHRLPPGRGGPSSNTGHGGMMRDNRWANENAVDRQAQAYRLAANICEPSVVWSGILPARSFRGSAYSCKVFLGGVPWDITEQNLNLAFGKFGQMKVEWPSTHNAEKPGRNSRGYLYIIFDNERSVRSLLANCTVDQSNGSRNYYYKVCSLRLRRKDVQVIPWQLADSAYVRNGCISTSGTKTVFVGSLHGMLNAEGLARVMDDLFGGVVAANVDTDKHKYPIGSGRVVFNCTHSYLKAIHSAFVELRTQKFSKKIQIDPFLEDTMCSVCNGQLGPYFCRDVDCFNYFCGTCWQWQHSNPSLKHHSPMMRNPRSNDEY